VTCISRTAVCPRHAAGHDHSLKAELRQAIAHPDQVPGDEIFSHVKYEDGSTEACLRRLWQDLYGDEPVPGTRRS
jgi:hypothetical protein